jgi:hypothetical protein
MLNIDELLTFSEAAKRVPAVGGRRVHANSIWRWARKGLNGVRLEVWRIGRRFVTSEAALHRFFGELGKAETIRSYAKPARKSRPRTSAERARALYEAERKLEESGFRATVTR